MTARSTYEATVKTAGQTQIATLIAAETTKQETINASGCNAGYYSGKGGSGETAFQAAIQSAIKALVASRLAAEQAKQASIAVARDTLRATNDLGPA